MYDVELDDESLRFPENQGGEEFIEGETKCGDEDAELKVVVWDNFNDTGDGTTYVSDFDDIRITKDGMAITIAFVPSGTDVVKPESAANLPELGAVDVPPPDSVLPGETVAPTDTAVPGATTVPGAATGSTTPAGSTPAPSATTTPSASAPPAPTATG